VGIDTKAFEGGVKLGFGESVEWLEVGSWTLLEIGWGDGSKKPLACGVDVASSIGNGW
jgi:hypothetical protein